VGGGGEKGKVRREVRRGDWTSLRAICVCADLLALRTAADSCCWPAVVTHHTRNRQRRMRASSENAQSMQQQARAKARSSPARPTHRCWMRMCTDSAAPVLDCSCASASAKASGERRRGGGGVGWGV